MAPGLTFMKIFECLLSIAFFSIKLLNSSVAPPGLISRKIFNIIKSKALFVHNHETKELIMCFHMCWYITLFDPIRRWFALEIVKNCHKCMEKHVQIWLCNYHTAMKPTTATPRLFFTTTTTTDMTRGITPWTTNWIHTSVLKCFFMNLWHISS